MHIEILTDRPGPLQRRRIRVTGDAVRRPARELTAARDAFDRKRGAA
ncbi:MAG TPA: hypothetical protein VMU33_14890 [Burkholderiaceae bacterium]|nr:hypothetical protein [Burkholderiaceae bacterium]